MGNEMLEQLRKQNRMLKICMALMGTLLAVVLLIGAAGKTRAEFSEITVERINVISPDGTRALVLAGKGRLPGPIVDGKEAEKRGDGKDRPGMLFYNDEGNEVGGLIYDGKLDDKGHANGGVHFSMDRYGGDQQVVLRNFEEGGYMNTGLSIYDSGLDKDYSPYEGWMKMPDGPEKDAMREKWKAAGGQRIERLFVGRSLENASAIILSDANGNPRIMMYVTPAGKSVLDFMDEKGEVVQSFPSQASAGKP